MAKLTDGRGGSIAKAEPPEKGQRFIFDDHRDSPRGFGLRITAAGGKAFILKYRSPITHKERRKTIGDWPTWTLEAARDEARELRQQIDKGVDPLEEDRRRKAEPTVAEAVELYIKSHIVGLTSEKPIRRYFERDMVPRLGDLKLTDVRRRDILEMVEEKAAATPTAARHLLTYTKGFFDWCVDREYIELSAAAGIKPGSIKGKGQKPLKPNRRKRILDDDEIRAFWTTAEGCGIHTLTALALKLVLVTGQRPGEVAGMREEELSGDMWVIPAERRGKTETEQRVPLTAEAQSIIERARDEVARLSVRRKTEPSGYIFETRAGQSVSVGALSKAVVRYTEELQNKQAPTWGHWTPHDLRRTARTGISACGVPSEVAERVIGHKAGPMEEVYNQHTYDAEKRAALEAWARRLKTIIAGGDPDKTNVVPINRTTERAFGGAK